MDHRIAKDMISSGMIPSGEKKQDDLNKTQYGTVPSPNALSDVYKKMYEHHKKDADGNTIPHEGEEINEAIQLAPLLAKVAKIGVKMAAKSKIPGATEVVKSVARNPMGAIDKVNRVGFAAQTVGNMMPKPSIPAVEKKKSSGGMVSASPQPQYASADLFDIVKGQLLDEGLSEEEIRDIMLTLTPDEIMNEMNAGPSTPVSIDKVEFPKPGMKVMPKTGATGIGKVRPKPGFKMNPVTAQLEKEEYKNFDPKKPDPKQMAAQAKQEQNRQKNKDPMGVKNRNIGGQGLDPMDK